MSRKVRDEALFGCAPPIVQQEIAQAPGSVQGRFDILGINVQGQEMSIAGALIIPERTSVIIYVVSQLGVEQEAADEAIGAAIASDERR